MLPKLAEEIRQYMVDVISANGGHLASSLGVVELTIALHRVFNTPDDKIIWDVGHQSYVHKILTGRKAEFPSIRQYGGLSGFPVISESLHDAFGTGHAGTSISAALGMALARDLKKEKQDIIAVIGDGSLGTGMAFEAINHTGQLGTKIIVVLNDNGMAISQSIGAVSRLLNQVRLNAGYTRTKGTLKNIIRRLPMGKYTWRVGRQAKNYLERVWLPSAFWEQLGFTYLGPFDGHDISELEAALQHARGESGPILIHVLTKKGKGYPAAESNVIKFHGISPSKSSRTVTFSDAFGRSMTDLMKRNEKVVAISAAMIDGTGMGELAREYPDRVFDVGICEQHAVTLAAGMATQGYLPVVALYSSFLQRAYDQIIHDVCLQKLPVIFAVDRAGLVGEDGKTHQGQFDISYLRCIPNVILASPVDEHELQQMLFSAVDYNSPVFIRYPRGTAENGNLSVTSEYLEPGKAQTLRQGQDLTIMAYGPVVSETLRAAEKLSAEGIECRVINARFAKPLDIDAIRESLEFNERLLTIEDNAAAGGFGSAVLEWVNRSGISGVKLINLGLPDRFIEHGSQQTLRSLLSIDAPGIAGCVHKSFPELFAGGKIAPNRG